MLPICTPLLFSTTLVCLPAREMHSSPCCCPGKNYIVNGEKKWITNGVTADWFTTAVRTGKDGMGGVSVLLIPRSEGVETRQMNCMGVYSSGTT